MTSSVIEQRRKCEEKLRLTVKILLNCTENTNIEDIIDKVLRELGVCYIETVVLAACLTTMETGSPLRQSWAALERLVKHDKVFTLGVADLNAQQLQAMFS
jgi:diketogulonate reductase-like aldo/keto reductase